MTCRVHYIAPDGRRAHQDVVATGEDARAVFRHLFPRAGQIESVQVIGAAPRRESSRCHAAGPEHVEAADDATAAEGFKKIREELDAVR